jgi:hypothetical protein
MEIVSEKLHFGWKKELRKPLPFSARTKKSEAIKMLG